MVKCINCDKKISFWKVLQLVGGECGAEVYICKYCGSKFNASRKSKHIFIMGEIFPLALAYLLRTAIQIQSTAIVLLLLIWLCAAWPYIWWKKFAEIEQVN